MLLSIYVTMSYFYRYLRLVCAADISDRGKYMSANPRVAKHNNPLASVFAFGLPHTHHSELPQFVCYRSCARRLSHTGVRRVQELPTSV